jgi:Asp-tRNA(Asn)/Glu-tRNA(Gln) amidotransferase A subunit family amidase
MRGRSNEEIQKEREATVEQLKAQGHEIIETIFDLEEGKNTPVHYLAKSIEAMAEVDGVVFMPGWEQARGCRIENQIALEYGKFVKFL